MSCQSRPLRANREASSESTAPTRPSQIAAKSFSKPGRRPPAPDLPRSASITFDISPSQLLGTLDQSVLPPLALQVLCDLKGC